MINKQFFNSRKFKYGTTASIITVLFIAVVIIVNIIMSTLSDKISTSIDLTSNKVFRLTDESKKFLSELKSEVEIVVLSSEDKFESVDQYFAQANKVLKQYSQNSNKIKISYIDPVKNPTYLSQYKDETITSNSVIVKTEDKYRILSVQDLFDIEQASARGGARIVASKAENAVTSAIFFVTGGKQTKIALIDGYAEGETQGLTELLQKNNFEIEQVSILSEDIPSDANAVIILGPGRDYDDTGVEKIKKFMENDGNHGKSLFVIPNPESQEYNRINEIIDPYGIKIGSGIVFETDSSRLVAPNPIFYVSEYADRTYTKDLKDSTIPVFTPSSLPIEVTNEEYATSLLQTSSKSGIIPDNADSSWKITQDALTGPITTAAASSKDDSKVFVFGSYDMFSSDIISKTSVNNASYVLNIFKTVRTESEVDADINIEPTSLQEKELGINVSQTNMLMILFVIAIPIAVLGLGIVVISFRKRKSRF